MPPLVTLVLFGSSPFRPCNLQYLVLLSEALEVEASGYNYIYVPESMYQNYDQNTYLTWSFQGVQTIGHCSLTQAAMISRAAVPPLSGPRCHKKGQQYIVATNLCALS
jgi:hypothetical protein